MNPIVKAMREDAAKALAGYSDPEYIDVDPRVSRAYVARDTSSRLCQLKISLDGIRPLIWRRIVVPHTIHLEPLHEVFQIALGWTDSHLHRFVAGPISFRLDIDDYFPLEEDEADESENILYWIAEKSKDRFEYIYDFGDDWTHTVVVERMLSTSLVPNAPTCLDGANAVPPEDCGGISGYRDLRKILNNPKHEDYADMRRWAGKRFNPAHFDIAAVNKRLAAYQKRGRLTPSMIPDIRAT